MKHTALLYLLLFSCLAGRTQTFTGVEYFYDTDPGFGKGTMVSVGGTAIDADFSFTAPNLPEGIHTLYVRAENSANQWSTVYEQNFLLTNGTVGPIAITAAEYFYDTDPGFGKGSDIPLNSTTMDSTLNFTAPNLVPGAHNLYIRLKSSTGDWSTVYQANFLLLAGAAGSTTITTAEYFYDKDHGIGLGNHLTLSSATLDSTVNFPDNGLAQGIHTLFIRLMNSSGEWSTTYHSTVSITTGAVDTASITGLEYFFDKDLGIGKNTRIVISGRALLDTTLSVAIPDNGADYRWLGLRLSDGNGLVGNVALDSVSLCDLLKPGGGFRYTQYGSTYTLIDTSTQNPTGVVRWQANGVPFDSSYSTNYVMPTASIPGSTGIAELTGTGCRVDTVTKTVIMPGVESYAPYLGSYNSDFDLNLYGGGLDTMLTVYLQNGGNIVYPYAKYSLDGNQHLIATFDFHGYSKTLGATRLVDNYDVHVIYSNGYEYVSPAGTPVSMVKQEAQTTGTTVSSCIQQLEPNGEHCPISNEILTPNTSVGDDSVPEPYFAVNMTGPLGVRAGEWTMFTMSITNTGTVVGRVIPFYILVPASFDIDSSQWTIVNSNPGLQDSIGVIVPIDTVINGIHQQFKLIAMFYPVLMPGQTGYFPLRIRTTVDTAFTIFYTTQDRMFGSPMTYLWGPCWGALGDFVIGLIPGVSCLYGFISGLNDIYNYNLSLGDHTWSQFFGMSLTIAGMAVSCVPGAGSLEKIGEAWAKEAALSRAALEEEVNVADKGLNTISNAHGAASSSDPCNPVSQTPHKISDITQLSFDPNYITGNSDYDTTNHFINNFSPQQYTIGFENEPSASANAQHVVVTDTLNPKKFNFGTFNLSSFFIGDSIYGLPPFRYSLTEDVGLNYRSDMKVRFSAAFDTATGILRTDFFSIDLQGNVLPPDSLDGFLPPDADNVTGRAGLTYSVYIQNLNTLDTFSNKATIVFDANAPLATNTWINTVDTSGPKGKITSAAYVNDSTLKLGVTQSDVGSGVQYDQLYVKFANDTVYTKAGVFTGDSVVFVGIPGSTYDFYVRTIDNVGNWAPAPAVADIRASLTKDTVTTPPSGIVRVVPNPVIQSMFVQNNTADDMYVQVFDLLGRRLLTTTAAAGATTTIDMAIYSTGMYIVSMVDKTSGTVLKTKVLKL